MEDIEDGNDDAVDPDSERKVEDKVQYGTDSESEFDRTDPVENYFMLEYSQTNEEEEYDEEEEKADPYGLEFAKDNEDS